MNYKILSLEDRDQWNSYLNRLPLDQQDIYFTPEYYSLYENYGDGKAYCFVFEKEGNTALYPFLINSINKLGYELDKEYFDIQGAYGYNGVVSSSYDVDFIESFYSAFNQFAIENRIVAEFTRFHPLIENHLFSNNYLPLIYDRKTVYLELNKEIDEIISQYKKSTRQEYRWCKSKFNLIVKVLENKDTKLNEFYTIYYDSMTRVNSNKYLFFSKNYFQDLINNVPNVSFYVYYDDKLIAAAITFIHGNYMQGHLGGTLTEYLYMSPNTLLYTEMAIIGKNAGCKYFHIGGGTNDDLSNKLLKFKLNFSSTTKDFFIGKRVYNEEIYSQICRQWKENFPNSYQIHSNKLLGYREI
jgi:hypothetical protein